MTQNNTQGGSILEEKNNSLVYSLFHRYFIVGLNGMALGLFCTLIIGLIIKQIGSSLDGEISNFLLNISSISMLLTGAVIGIGVSFSLKSPKLVILASGVTGFLGAFGSQFFNGKLIDEAGRLIISGAGDPLGAFLSVVVGAEMGRLVFGKTKIDIIVTPLVTIISGSLVAFLVGPYILSAMKSLGDFIRVTTELQPFFMGIMVSVVMGIILTLPISSAALSIILGLSGLASGAATVGCSAQMIGFAVISYKENKLNGLLAQGLGTSMLQVPNIMRKPVIWIPPIIASAILGPVATMIFKMQNNPAGGGMGTSGLVGQLMTWQSMSSTMPPIKLISVILLLHFIFPAVISLIVAKILKKYGIINDSDYRLDL